MPRLLDVTPDQLSWFSFILGAYYRHSSDVLNLTESAEM